MTESLQSLAKLQLLLKYDQCILPCMSEIILYMTEPNGEESAETILPDPKSEDEVLMFGKTFKRACLLNWFELVNNEENYS